jgi:hypothetical protein
VLIESDTSLDLIRRHLKENYSLGCSFVSHNNTRKKNASSFDLNDDTLILGLITFFYNQGFQFRIFNSEGISIPPDLSLKQAINFNINRSDDYDFKQLESSLHSIANSSNYEDMEWVKRLFLRAFKKATTNAEKELVNDLLVKIHSENDKFLDSDLTYINKLVNN